MESGKQNEPIRNKLEGLAVVPEGFNFNADVTWRRLEGKMKMSQRKKRFLPLYATAASLVFAVLLVLNLYSPVKEKAQLPVTVQTGRSMFVKPVKEKKPVHYISSEKQQPVSFKKDIKNTKAVSSGEKITTALPSITVINNQAQWEEINVDTIAIDDIETKTTVAQKTRFRIAHVNELHNNPSQLKTEEQIQKNKYVLALRHHPSFNSSEVIAEEIIYPAKKQKSLLGLLNTQ